MASVFITVASVYHQVKLQLKGVPTGVTPVSTIDGSTASSVYYFNAAIPFGTGRLNGAVLGNDRISLDDMSGSYYTVTVTDTRSLDVIYEADFEIAGATYDLDTATPIAEAPIPGVNAIPEPPAYVNKTYVDTHDASTLAAAKTYTDENSGPSGVGAETTRAEAAEAVLATSISTEASTRATAITTEATARASADTAEVTNRNIALSAGLTIEVTNRNTAIAVETSRATAAEGVIAGNLATEITNRTTAVSGEATARTTGDAASVTTSEGYTDTHIATEVTNRNTAIGVEATNRNTAIGVETSRATSAEGVIAGNLTTEISRAEAAEGSISSDLSDEITRAEGAEAVIATDLSEEEIRALAVEGTLTTNLASEVTRATTAEGTLTTAVGNKLNSSAVDTDVNLAANSDTRVPSQKAIKAYIAAHSGGAAKGNVAFTAPLTGTNVYSSNGGYSTFARMYSGLLLQLPASWRFSVTTATGIGIVGSVVYRTLKSSLVVVDSTPVLFSGLSTGIVLPTGETYCDAIAMQLDLDHDYYIVTYYDGSSPGGSTVANSTLPSGISTFAQGGFLNSNQISLGPGDSIPAPNTLTSPTELVITTIAAVS